MNQPAEHPPQEQRRGCTDWEKHEASFDDTLQQAALAAVHTLLPNALQDQHQARVFQQMSRAMLLAYVQQHRKPPSPQEIQHMRDLIRTLWKELIQEYRTQEVRETMTDFLPLADGDDPFLDTTVEEGSKH